jgi:hypothetical protein
MLSSTVALAVTRQCEAYSVTESGACHGTEGSDTLLGTQDPNLMFAK